jgi:hypothetical protein
MKYVGQTGRPFRVRFQVYFRDYKYANNKSKFSQHLLDNSHSRELVGYIVEVIKSTE